MVNYMKDKEFFAVSFGLPRNANIRNKFNITGIPNLVILKSNGDLVSTTAKNDIMTFGAKAFENWSK